MRSEILIGDCLDVMKTFPDNHFSAIVTDPPYGLSFMNKGWDHTVPGIEYWKECLRITKPGGYLLAMGGTRKVHRLTYAIEDAGFEIRDCLSYLYGSGFPKSHNFGCKCIRQPVPYSHENAQSSSESCLRSLPKTDLSSQIDSIDKQREVLFTGMQEQGSQSERPISAEGDEGRQSNREFRDDEQLNTQDGTQRYSERIALRLENERLRFLLAISQKNG